MGDIATKIVELNTVKSSIKSAIASKGIDMTGVPFTEYPEKINEIVAVADTFTLDGTTLNITSTSSIFSLSGTTLTITNK